MSMSDKELVMLIQATKDAASFGELARRHQAGLRAFLRRLTNDAARADDLAQDALIKAYDKIMRFRNESTFRTWLFKIAYREFLQERRKSGVIGRLLEAVKGEAETMGTAMETANQAEFSIDVDRALSTLGKDEKAALILCDACGFSHSEAAEALAMPLGTIKSHVKRGREKARSALARAETEASHA